MGILPKNGIDFAINQVKNSLKIIGSQQVKTLHTNYPRPLNNEPKR